MTTYDAELPSLTTRRSAWHAPALVCAAFIAALIPVFVSEMPPVMDFPNHLTRIWLLSGGADSPPLSAIYEARWWQASTNLAVDFIGTVLMRVLGMTATSKILLAAMLIGPPLGAAALNRAVFGRFHVWQILGVMLAWSTTAVEGFLSFQIGLAAALFCAAAAKPMLEAPTARGLGIVFLIATGLLLIHPFAVLFFLLIAAGLAIGEQRLPWFALWRRSGRVLSLSLATVLPLALLFLVAPHPPGGHTTGVVMIHYLPLRDTFALSRLIVTYASPLISYKILFDFITAIPLVVLLVWVAVTGHMRMHFGLLLVAVPVFLIAPLLPTNIGDGGALPIRLPIMALLMAVGATRPQMPSARMERVLAIAVVAVATLRVSAIGWVWWQRSNDVVQLREVVEPVTPGSAVLVLQQKWHDTHEVPLGRLVAGCPTFICASERHFATLTVVWRHAFIPAVFTVPGQHPLGVREPWRKKSVYASGIPFANEITVPDVIFHNPYLKDWQHKFDYVLLLDADLGKTAIPFATLVRHTGFASLYRVRR